MLRLEFEILFFETLLIGPLERKIDQGSRVIIPLLRFPKKIDEETTFIPSPSSKFLTLLKWRIERR